MVFPEVYPLVCPVVVFLLLLIISICARLNIHEKFLVYFKYHTVLIERLVLCVYEEYRYASLWPEPRYYHSIINELFRRGDGGECQGSAGGHQSH